MHKATRRKKIPKLFGVSSKVRIELLTVKG